MDIITGIIYFVIVVIGIRYIPFFRQTEGLSYRMLLVFFTLKVFSGTILILIYTYYYDLSIADFHKYFVDGKIMFSALQNNPLDYLKMVTGISSQSSHLDIYYNSMTSWYRPWESPVYNDSRIIVRFNAIVFLISFGSIYVHNVVVNLLSFIGLIFLYRFFVKYTPNSKIFWLPWGIFLFPGILFWGSGILKEGFLIMAFGPWLYYSDKIVTGGSIKPLHIFALAMAGLVLAFLKPYNLLFLIPCQLAFYWGMPSNTLGKHFRYVAVLMIWVLLGIVISNILPKYDIISIVARKQNDFVNFSIVSEAGSLIHSHLIKPNFWDMVLFFPKGLWNVLTRPHIFESYSAVVLFAAIENLFIAGIIILAIFRIDKTGLSNPVVWFTIWFSVLLMGFVGLVTPVHGAFVRYKILALPFIWVAFINLTRLPNEAWFNNRIFRWLLKDK